MFGYIKPDKDNLLVKDLALYKATYCGLCAVIKKEISFLLPFTLSYDFVFLAMLRAAMAKEKPEIKKGACKYNPLKKCAFALSKSETLFTARCSLILTALKLEDDIRDPDTSFFRRLLTKPLCHHYLRLTKKLENKHNEFRPLIEGIKNKLLKLNELERSSCEDIDKVCEVFGDIMSEIAEFSVEEHNAPIARQIGSAIGKYIYLIDAMDDIDKDFKSGAYNPLTLKFGSAQAAKARFDELDIILSMYAKQAVLAVNLIENNEYTRIMDNILSQGLGLEAYRIMTKNGDKE